MHSARDADASAFSQTFQASRDVDPISVNSLLFNHHVADINAHAVVHLSVCRKLGVSHGQFCLYLNRTLHRVNHTRKLGQEIIAGRIDHPTGVLLNSPGHQLPVRGQRPNRGDFIIAHEAAIALNIRAQDGGEFAPDGGRVSL